MARWYEPARATHDLDFFHVRTGMYSPATLPHGELRFKYARKVRPGVRAVSEAYVEAFAEAMANRGSTQNARADLGRAWNRQAGRYLPASPGSPFGYEPAAWMGRQIGRGSFGIVHAVEADRAAPQLRAIVDTAQHRVVRGMPEPGSLLALKLVPWYDPGARRLGTRFIRENVREAATHAWLLDRPPLQVPGCGAPLLPRDHLPDLYVAGLVKNATDGLRFYVTAMDEVHGLPLHEVMNRRGFTAEVYVRVERAVASLWVNRIAHADLHTGNVLYDPRTGRVTILDLGLAVLLPRRFQGEIVSRLACGVAMGVRSLAEIFRPAARSRLLGIDGLQDHVNGVMKGREMTLYYAEYSTLLRQMFNKLSPADQRAVPGARARLWKARAGPAGPACAPRSAPARSGSAGSQRSRRRAASAPARKPRRRTPRTPAVSAASRTPRAPPRSRTPRTLSRTPSTPPRSFASGDSERTVTVVVNSERTATISPPRKRRRVAGPPGPRRSPPRPLPRPSPRLSPPRRSPVVNLVSPTPSPSVINLITP